MKKNQVYLTICLLLLTEIINAQSYVWLQCSTFPGGVRYSPFGFAIGSKAYVGGGVTYPGGVIDYNHVDFWEYDPATDIWTQKADFAGPGRNGSSGFAIGNKGYVTLGWIPTQVNDTWEYDPATNGWTQKANFGGAARYDAASFVLGNYAFVGMGYSPWSTDFWKYDPALDVWTQIADIPGVDRQCGSGFTIDGYGYVVGGSQQFNNYSDELYQYDTTSNTWTAKAPFPGPPRTSAMAFVFNGKGIVGCGANYTTTYTDMYIYDPVTDSWSNFPSFPGGNRMQGLSCNIPNMGFAGFGSPTIYPDLQPAGDFWKVIYTDANNIYGKLYMDFNNNNLQDAGEPLMTNKLVTETTSGRFTFTDLSGFYDLSVLTPGSFNATTDSIGFFAPNPSSYAVNFSGINQADSSNDFAFQATATINDLCVSMTPVGNFRAGFDAHYTISYENSGTTALPGSITFFPDSNLTFVSSSVTPDSVYADSIFWDLGIINPFQQGSFTVTLNINSSVLIGTMIHSLVRIDPVAGDANPGCNYDEWAIPTTGSFDPNDIIVNIDTLQVAQLSNAPYLEYIINFQNTGNDTAFTVDILNPVPAEVDLSSFELVSSSHPVAVRYIQDYNTLGFKFSNILLVDSNMNEPLSHGFVRYRIKPLSSLIAGSVIPNTAGIYFDFNPVVNTNTALTHIVNTTSIEEISSNQFSISPNPVKDKIIVATKGVGDYKISVYNTQGKCVLNNVFKGKKIEIPFKYFSNGIYLVSVEGGGEIIRTKIYKE